MFILDTKDKIYQFNGANSNIQERAKALEVIQFLKDKYHEGKCDVAIVGKLLILTIFLELLYFSETIDVLVTSYFLKSVIMLTR